MRAFQVPHCRCQIALAVLSAVAAGGCMLLKTRAPEPPSVPIAWVPEMEQIKGFDGGAPCKPEDFAEEVKKAREDWAAKRPGVERLITAQVVRDLSRWAKKQMEQYKRVPSLDKVPFKPVACHKDARRLVLEGEVDTLPTHSQLVTRWLKVYLLYDQEKQSIAGVAVTIRGQLLE